MSGNSKHQPCFHARTQGGSCLNLPCIYDGDEMIAVLSHRSIDEPEHELLYFGKNPRPLLLRQIKLKPGGPPQFDGLQMFWQWNQHQVATTQLVDLSWTGDGTEALSLTAVTRDPQGIATSTRTVTVTYEADANRYLYRVDAHLQVHHPGSIDGGDGDTVELEMADPWFCDLPAPSQRYKGMWPKSGHTHLFVEQDTGQVWKLPINHRASRAHAFPSHFKKDGHIVAGYVPGANPAIQLCDDTGPRTRLEVCHWAYDLHLITQYSREQLQQPIHEQFVLTLANDTLARGLMASSEPLACKGFMGHRSLPYYERSGSFANGTDLAKPSAERDIDPYFWEPMPSYESGLSWCHDTGRSDDHSLKIQRDVTGVSRWWSQHEGQGSFVGWWPTTSTWRVTCWVKTKDVSGAASVGVQWHMFHQPVSFPVHRKRISGTSDWTQLQIDLPGPAPQGVWGISLILEQDGTGTTWFDDLKVENFPSSQRNDQ